MARIIALITLLIFAPSCATLFASNTRDITITSNPPGAQVALNGQNAGVTPTRVSVNDHEKLVVAVTMPGYQPAGCYMNTSIGAVWLVLDILLFYTVIPLVVDLVTNNWSSLDGEFCSVQLVPAQAQPYRAPVAPVQRTYPPR